MEKFNGVDDKESTKIELKVMKRFMRLIGPQNDIVFKSSLSIVDDESKL